MTASMDHAPAQANSLRQFLVLTLGSVGVVYGDIGTSPLYAFREALRRERNEWPTVFLIDGIGLVGSVRTSALPASA
jgi:K+ transporter